MNQQNVTEFTGAWIREKLQLSPDDLAHMKSADPSECWQEETATGLTVHLGGGVIREIVTVSNEPPHLSLVPMPGEYSDTTAPLDTSPHRDSVAALVRCAHELELCATSIQPDDMPDAAPLIERAADAVRRLQSLENKATA
jgi:hypothetical protein